MTDPIAYRPADRIAYELDTLAKAFPIGRRATESLSAGDAGLPRDSFTGRTVSIRVLPTGAIGYNTPWALTGRTIRKVKFYEATWLDTNNKALFKSKRDAADFLDLHRYAVGVRRITGELPAWATVSNH